jgi:hypothetical protein
LLRLGTVIVQAVGPAQEPVDPPGLAVAVYCVIADPPLLPGAVKVTVAWASPAVAVPIVGAPGTVGTATVWVEPLL